MNIKKILKESLENYGDSVVFKDKTKKEVYGTGFCIKNNDSFISTINDKFIMFNLETGTEYDITDVVEIICDNIQEEIEERLS